MLFVVVVSDTVLAGSPPKVESLGKRDFDKLGATAQIEVNGKVVTKTDFLGGMKTPAKVTPRKAPAPARHQAELQTISTAVAQTQRSVSAPDPSCKPGEATISEIAHAPLRPGAEFIIRGCGFRKGGVVGSAYTARGEGPSPRVGISAQFAGGDGRTDFVTTGDFLSPHGIRVTVPATWGRFYEQKVDINVAILRDDGRYVERHTTAVLKPWLEPSWIHPKGPVMLPDNTTRVTAGIVPTTGASWTYPYYGPYATIEHGTAYANGGVDKISVPRLEKDCRYTRFTVLVTERFGTAKRTATIQGPTPNTGDSGTVNVAWSYVGEGIEYTIDAEAEGPAQVSCW